ncbi:kinase-like domain-containing protein [Mycena crocata]|nr:kinase-like domain-containing protein [Mycena crocata]
MASPSDVENQKFRGVIAETQRLYRTYPDIYKIWEQHSTQKLLPESKGAVVWYSTPAGSDKKLFCVQLTIGDGEDTLAWRIAHYEADLPRDLYYRNVEINGDSVTKDIPFLDPPEYPEDGPEIDEDCTVELARLALIEYDPSIHFVKKARFKAEITNLLLCQGSPHVVELLGKTADNQLVFPKYKRDLRQFAIGASFRLSERFTIGFVKKMLLSLIDGLEYLHSKGIIHCDLTARNLLMSGDLESEKSKDPLESGNPAVVICDLQCYAASYSAAPELKIDELADRWDLSTFSFQSDIYALGVCLREFILPIHHRSMLMGFDVPPPFKTIYEECTQKDPRKRPTLEAVRQKALQIQPE